MMQRKLTFGACEYTKYILHVCQFRHRVIEKGGVTSSVHQLDSVVFNRLQ